MQVQVCLAGWQNHPYICLSLSLYVFEYFKWDSALRAGFRSSQQHGGAILMFACLFVSVFVCVSVVCRSLTCSVQVCPAAWQNHPSVRLSVWLSVSVCISVVCQPLTCSVLSARQHGRTILLFARLFVSVSVCVSVV